jgi:hypothetical protein
MIEQKDWVEALKRIALTEDGWLLYCGLHKVAISLPDGADPSDGALRRNLGRRSVAREIMDVMAEGIDERGRRTGPGTDKLSEQPVAFAKPKPVAVASARGAGRRVTDDTIVPGYDTTSET